MVRCLRGRGSGRGRGRGREGSAGLACGVRQQRVEGERASWQGGLWGWQWVGAAVVAEVGEEVEAVVAGEWKQGLARGQWGRGLRSAVLGNTDSWRPARGICLCVRQ